MSFGQHGGVYAATDVSSGVVTIPAGKVVVAVTSLHDNTEFTNADAGFPQINNIAIAKGITVYGRWSSLTIDGTSGAAIVYFGP